MRHRTDLFKTDKFGTGRRSPPRPAESETRSRGRARSCHRRGKARSQNLRKACLPARLRGWVAPPAAGAASKFLTNKKDVDTISVIWKSGFSRNRAASESTHLRP